jgi:hypothetical protein
MKIPQQYNQFTGKRALILVAGKQDEVMYEAADGEINQIDALKVTRPHYSDNEGRSKARSHNGGSIRSSTSTEIRDQDTIKDFMKELKLHMQKVHAELYDEVHILAPQKSRNTIIDNLPSQVKNKVRQVIDGNYTHSGPLEAIKKIQQGEFEETKNPIPMTKEAQRILDQSEQAKSVIRDTF